MRDLAPRVLAAVTRRFGDFAAAEDAVQDALIAASVQWPRTGTPDNPGGWLFHVASRRMVDGMRSEASRRRREEGIAPDDVAPSGDDTLALLFLCCHPSLTPSSAIALTLRAVGGLTTAEIARAFLVPEATMAQRISRAKASITASGIGFDLPIGADRADRLASVLHVLYLLFNEGYASTSGPALQRIALSAEAIRLTRALLHATPDDPEVGGLLALMLLTDARRDARTGPAGELIPLDEQDRGRWDRRAIAEGTEIATRAIGGGRVGPYQLQAAIAALHDEAPSAETTDWPQILALYGLLGRMSDNPIVALNAVIAASMVRGPATGLALLDHLAADERLAGHHRLEAVRAHLLERAGDAAAAIAGYRSAAALTTSGPERNYLLARASRLAG